MIIQHNGAIIKELQSEDIHIALEEVNGILHDIHQQGKVVRTITVDGIDVTGTLEVFMVSNKNKVKIIDIESVSPNEIMIDIYEDTVEFLKKVAQSVETISDKFYGEVDYEAWEQLSQLSQALGFTLESLEVISNHIKRNDQYSIIPNEVSIYVESIKGHVNKINKAIEDQDTIMIGDILKYELVEAVSRMVEIMTSREMQ